MKKRGRWGKGRGREADGGRGEKAEKICNTQEEINKI